jgi:hypothetical protein
LNNLFFSLKYPQKYVTCYIIYESLEKYRLLKNEIIKSEKKDLGDTNNNDDYKKYYFPKVLCFVSVNYNFDLHEKILKQIYQYYIDKHDDEKLPTPLEKIIMSVLFNIIKPLRGFAHFSYQLGNKYEKIVINQSEKK